MRRVLVRRPRTLTGIMHDRCKKNQQTRDDTKMSVKGAFTGKAQNRADHEYLLQTGIHALPFTVGCTVWRAFKSIVIGA